jgi:hypothetical protein
VNFVKEKLSKGPAIAIVINDEIAGRGPTALLLRCRPVCCCLLGLDLCLSDNICLMDGALYDLLLFWVQILCQVFVERWLLLLEACLNEYMVDEQDSGELTEQRMLEHAVWLNFVEGSL